MDENVNTNLGKFLQLARESKQLSLRAVEKATGVSNAYLSQVESGKIKQPSPTILHKLSELFEVSYADLLVLAGHPIPSENDSADKLPRTPDRFGMVTPDEEQALVEYLAFLRSRKGRKE
ncbi:MAG: helix-turn-helix domain-containing protein [Anaerolineaceae bacterium]|nr:helix-turn-helix domain-containing protein [Anaerolineaceae bacterium]